MQDRRKCLRITDPRPAIPLVWAACAAVIVGGCCGRGKKSKDVLCEGSLERDGAFFHAIGTSEDPKDARDSAVWGACYSWCATGEATVLAAHAEWKKGAQGQASRMSVRDEMDSQPALETKLDGCREACIADVAAGKLPVKIDCHAPQGGVKCTTSVELGGKNWQASDSGGHSEYHSKRLACRRWCKEGDPAMDVFYTAWAASEQGKSSAFSTREAAMEGDGVLFDELNMCQEGCMADLLSGKTTAKTTCE